MVSFPDLDTNAMPAIVQVIVTFQEYDSFLPWQTKHPADRRGYGVVVGESRVITTESLIRNHKLVELRQPGSGEKVLATVVMSDYQANLALLRIPGTMKAAGLTPVQIADHVAKGAGLRVLQFDDTSQVQHGDARILQIAMSPLPRSSYRSLAFTLLTDLNINGQGAPVVYEGLLAGLIMNYDHSTLSGKMLPYPVITRFLDDISESPYTGFASAGFLWTSLVSPVKRAYLNVGNIKGGILVLSCLPGTGAAQSLEADDVILECDGYALDNLGFYEDPEFGKLAFSYLIKGRHEPGEVISMRIIRHGAETTVKLKLANHPDGAALIPENVTGHQSEYLITGGFVIRELTGRYLREHGADWERTVDPRLVHLYLTRKHRPECAGDRIVILAAVLPDPINIGYQHFADQIITRLNGRPVTNMADVFNVADTDGSVHRITLQSVGTDLVLDKDELPAADSRLARFYRVPRLRHQRQVSRQP